MTVISGAEPDLPLSPKIKIFSDFDGTISLLDVGDAFFEHFAGPEIREDIRRYEGRLIGAKELFRRGAARIRNISLEAVESFCAGFDLDPAFRPFLDWCASKRIDLVIVSDGMDVYVKPLLARAGIDVPFFCNEMRILPNGRAEVSFPWDNAESADCANCKRNILLTRSGDEDIIVLVGDGYSDRCPARYADLVFAKGSLETWCQRENISFTMFRDFDDVRKKLEQVIARKRFRRPHQAMLRRSLAWRRE